MFVARISSPTIIDGPGEYLTRGGERVTVEEIERHRTARGAYANGVTCERWDTSGHVLPWSDSQNDIVSKAPASHSAYPPEDFYERRAWELPYLSADTLEARAASGLKRYAEEKQRACAAQRQAARGLSTYGPTIWETIAKGHRRMAACALASHRFYVRALAERRATQGEVAQ